MRNTVTLKAKAQTHEVRVIDDHAWQVTSGTSGNEYEVHRHGDNLQCSCKWGTAGGQRWARKQSGCSHVAAVASFLAEEAGRKASIHDGEDAAKRQRRPMMALGQGLYLTSRVA